MKQEKAKKPVALIIVLVIMTLIAIAGWSVAIYGMKEYGERTDAIIELQAKNEDLQSRIDKLSVVDDRYGNFIQTDNWDVKFAFTDSVTDVKAATGNKFDGSIYITSVTKDGKTYDASVCPDVTFSDENPFFLGEVVRYNNYTQRDKDAKKPTEAVEDTYSELSRTSRYDYYINYNIKNGCETNKDFKAGADIAAEILRTIQMKN